MKPIHHRLAVAALFAGIGASAFAQPAAEQAAPPPPPAQQQQYRVVQPGRGVQIDPRQRAEEHFARKLDVLKTRLQLTPQQEGAWAQYTAAIRPAAPPADGARRFDPREFEKLTTPERLGRLRALRQEHSARAEQHEQAVRTFYAALNPAQKKVFDLESLPHHHHPDFHHGGPGPFDQGGPFGHGGEHGPHPADGTPPAPAQR
ncbi:Spy/CpxP family protein refolding chaperone [Xylophilus sp.]|uniref:Spy/CpxP family protein refolding chaperone n=1 Tax=Xylophilus sp. TaxID=2653893 RepID=UPI0013B8F1F8|nr:Spy/CpxP family protein refolding chaperone [Xylophilus sp.]KAF1050136.1 MAG: hypothetical protein GAK38_00161 [Xylophilus sp.]